jgi:hypothetical protein
MYVPNYFCPVHAGRQAYIDTSIRVHIHSYIPDYIRMPSHRCPVQTCVSMTLCMHAYIHTCTHTLIHTRLYSHGQPSLPSADMYFRGYLNVIHPHRVAKVDPRFLEPIPRTRVCLFVCVCVYIYTHIDICVYTHEFTYVRIHAFT